MVRPRRRSRTAPGLEAPRPLGPALDHDAPAEAFVLVEFVNLEGGIVRVGEFGQHAEGRGAEDDCALVVGVGDRQNLLPVRGLLGDPADVGGLQLLDASFPAHLDKAARLIHVVTGSASAGIWAAHKSGPNTS